MRVNLCVYVDDEAELAAALDAVRAGLPPGVFARGRSFHVSAWAEEDDLDAPSPRRNGRGLSVVPDTFADQDVDPDPDPDPEPAPAPAPTPAPDAAAPPPVKRRRKAAAPADPPAEPEPEPEPDTDADADPLGLNEPVEDPPLTPAQSKVEALERLRKLFAQPGGAEIVKNVMAKYGVNRFAEVPDGRGHELLADAIAAEKEYAAFAT